MTTSGSRRNAFLITAGGVLALLVLVLVFAPSLLIVPEGEESGEDSAPERWACPMLCVVLDKAGICPVCGMDLERIESGEDVTVGVMERELIGLSLAMAEPRVLQTVVRLPGRVVETEPSHSMVTAWTSGRIDQFPAPSSGEQVYYGQTVAYLYSPELIEAQNDLITSTSEGKPDAWTEGARERLRQLGAGQWLIDHIESTGTVLSSAPVSARHSGTVMNRFVEAGDWVSRGDPLLQVADLGTVWVEVILMDGRQGLLAVGDTLMVSAPSLGPGSVPGEVELVEPFIDRATQSFEARLVLDSVPARWLPGQLVSAEVQKPVVLGADSAGSVLSVPASSVLSLGDRHVVYVLKTDEGEEPSINPPSILGLVFEPRTVMVGERALGQDGELYVPVLSGLEEGEVVALEGAFLLDSQAELTGLESLLNPGAPD